MTRLISKDHRLDFRIILEPITSKLFKNKARKADFVAGELSGEVMCWESLTWATPVRNLLNKAQVELREAFQ